jgi:acetyl esterase/lipase
LLCGFATGEDAKPQSELFLHGISPMSRSFGLTIALLLLLPCAIRAQQPTLDVWPAMPPGDTGEVGPEKLLDTKPGERQVKRLTNVTRPTITVYRAPRERDTHAAVLICPGGRYNILAMDLEGEEVAAWLNSIGVTGIVLKYRVPRRKDQPPHQLPLMDAQRAMSLVRAHAKEWDLRPDRIGILGFSAGGHLAAATATNFDRRTYQPMDDVDKLSARPDFTVLIYPAYLTVKGKDQLAPEIRVTKESPPTFFAHAGDDGVSPENSIAMCLALKRAGVPAELHVYGNGGHGFGLRPTTSPATTWPARCEEWLRTRGILPSATKFGS